MTDEVFTGNLLENRSQHFASPMLTRTIRGRRQLQRLLAQKAFAVELATFSQAPDFTPRSSFLLLNQTLAFLLILQ